MFNIFLEDGRYEQGSLEDHLGYLRTWGGTPDVWDTAENIGEAVDSARELLENGLNVTIVDDNWNVIDTLKVVDTLN